ncbi:MAG: hypothetical protein ACWA5K_03675 [bacterium]
MFLDSLPDIDEYRYQEGNKHHITQEWLCGTFAGRGFVGATPEEAVGQLLDYLDRHLGHDSMVGRSVTESGWPDLDSVNLYLIASVYEVGEET